MSEDTGSVADVKNEVIGGWKRRRFDRSTLGVMVEGMVRVEME